MVRQIDKLEDEGFVRRVTNSKIVVSLWSLTVL